MMTSGNAPSTEDALRRLALPGGARLGPPSLTGDVSYLLEDTALGRMLLATRADGVLVASSFAPSGAAEKGLLERLARAVSPRVIRTPAGPGLDDVRRQLAAYLAGRRRRFELAVDPVLATSFQRTVLARLPEVGYGARISYRELATRLGRPQAARAVGAALGANPLCVVLPCHRVVASSGALTGYAGGLEAKQLLLDLEAGLA
jgi:methylated-DNA-[protein]-cysteine S-methyltransferase